MEETKDQMRSERIVIDRWEIEDRQAELLSEGRSDPRFSHFGRGRRDPIDAIG
jgi:hypothetical protein